MTIGPFQNLAGVLVMIAMGMILARLCFGPQRI